VLSIVISVGGRRLATDYGPAEPDRERAETYLRLQAEAELQRPLGFLRGVVSDILEWRERRDEIRSDRREAAGERWLSSGWKPPRDRRPANNRLLRIAALGRALAAAGAIDDATAAEVLADLQAALAIRSLIPKEKLLQGPDSLIRRFASPYFPGERVVPPATSPAAPLRLVPVGMVAACEVEHQRVRMYLGSMVVEGNSATLSINARLAPGRTARKPLPVAWDVLNSCTATDDQGNTYGMQFSGGGDEDNWTGMLHIRPVPPGAIRWLDFGLPGTDPVRLRIDTAPPSFPTTKVALPADQAADRYLDAQTVDLLVTDDEGGAKDPGVAWDALGLLAAGVVSPLNPALRRLAAVASRLGLELPEPLAAIPPEPLPDDWLSLLARLGSYHGPTGAIPVAAHIPELDGAQCAIADIQSSPEAATFKVHARGWPEPRNSRPLWRELFRWTARDDVGGWYVTTVEGWSYHDKSADLTLALRPPIDPAARQLTIILTSRTGEVSVSVPLDWREGL
jgi:hypothetical protein